mmetsp:Transcript_33336/g.85168  ORF Transcript_33336/g.85168 Transcript_33336/m.85168 type:complete len:207 (-) Transcript_33336:128-748(-)
MPTGVVKKWFEEKGFGFLTPEGRGQDVFVHRRALVGTYALEEGAQVAFEAEFDEEKNKWKAVTCAMTSGPDGGEAVAILPPQGKADSGKGKGGKGGGMGKGKGKGGGGGGFKTKMCTFFLEGRCTKGEACTYAHDPSEMSGGKGGGGKSFGGGAPAAVQLPAGLFANAGAFGAPVDDLDSMLMQQMQEAAGAEAFEAVDPSAFGLS